VTAHSYIIVSAMTCSLVMRKENGMKKSHYGNPKSSYIFFWNLLHQKNTNNAAYQQVTKLARKKYFYLIILHPFASIPMVCNGFIMRNTIIHSCKN